MLRVIICSKALTSNHHVAFLEYDDGTYEFTTLRGQGPVKSKEPATKEYSAPMSRAPLVDRIREHFKDSLEKAATFRAQTILSTEARRSHAGAGPTIVVTFSVQMS
jgi:hypothetical protein